MKHPSIYRSSAHLYDLHPGLDAFHDLDFYLRWAQKARGEILELACGTGRLTIPIAEAGYAIHGLDLSPTMLEVFAKKWRICRQRSPRASPSSRAIWHSLISDVDLD